MNDLRYRYILYVITIVIIATIGIQVYWNFKNYESNKQQLINDVQVSLDKAVDDYYADLAKNTQMGLTFESTSTKAILDDDSAFSKILKNIDEKNGIIQDIDTIDTKNIKGLKIYRGFQADSLLNARRENTISSDSLKERLKDIKKRDIKLDLSKIEMLSTMIMITVSNDSLDILKLDSLLVKDLERKKIDIDHKLRFFDKTPDSTTLKNSKKQLGNYNLEVESKSSFLPKDCQLFLNFTNETLSVLKRSFTGILISAFLVLVIISCLFYMLKIIRNQKQLAEVKNDLISNITHEFKTPIATIGVALESINNFEAIDDKEKTKRYVDMSSTQLNKLNLMVEKLLETATLDSESLQLNIEHNDIVNLLDTLCDRYRMHHPEKTINSSFKIENLIASIDVFHFENALNNILDNAIKYGGDIISIDLKPNKNSFEISISDNGSSLTKANKDKIFEKFYRVPKGNQHDVKGFGIGLFYTKSIIEKHGGKIDVELNKSLTTFKITMSNG